MDQDSPPKKLTQIMTLREKCLDCFLNEKIKGIWTCPFSLIPYITEDKKFVECNGFIDWLPKIAPARKAFEKERRKFQA